MQGLSVKSLRVTDLDSSQNFDTFCLHDLQKVNFFTGKIQGGNNLQDCSEI